MIVCKSIDPDRIRRVQLVDEKVGAKLDDLFKLDHVPGDKDLLNVVLVDGDLPGVHEVEKRLKGRCI